jgi:hypothetical protein
MRWHTSHPSFAGTALVGIERRGQDRASSGRCRRAAAGPVTRIACLHRWRRPRQAPKANPRTRSKSCATAPLTLPSQRRPRTGVRRQQTTRSSAVPRRAVTLVLGGKPALLRTGQGSAPQVGTAQSRGRDELTPPHRMGALQCTHLGRSAPLTVASVDVVFDLRPVVRGVVM